MEIQEKQYEYINRLELNYVKEPLLNQDLFKKINQASKIVDMFREIFNSNEFSIRESFFLICLNTKHDVVGFKKIADGGISSILVDIRLVFSTALLANSSSIIIAHNHPSGNKLPSGADRQLTQKIKEAGKLLDIELLDHIILTEDDHYSFANEGEL